MRFEISNRLREWLKKEGRLDLANLSEIDISELKYLELYSEVRQQHPAEELSQSKDRALFRMLTHPDWAPTRKRVVQINHAKRDRSLIYLWAIAVLLLLVLLLFAVRSHGQDKARAAYEAQGNQLIKPVSPAEGLPAPPALTTDQKFRIRDLQHKYDELRLQMAKLEMDKLKLERQITAVLSTINGVAFDIAKESKVATDSWDLNIDSLTWEKRK